MFLDITSYRLMLGASKGNICSLRYTFVFGFDSVRAIEIPNDPGFVRLSGGGPLVQNRWPHRAAMHGGIRAATRRGKRRNG